jgi:hypothetical protein
MRRLLGSICPGLGTRDPSSHGCWGRAAPRKLKTTCQPCPTVFGKSCFLVVISEDMEHEKGLQCLHTQLSRKMSATVECTAFYQTQRAVLKELQEEKVETISCLA